MTLEISVNALTTQTTALLETCVALRSSTATLIAGAVTTSENASQIPLANMATNMINTQALFVTHLTP